MSDRLSARAKAIIDQVIYITIASVSGDGKPWNAPVFSAYDDKYCFYWGSYRDSQHSQNVRANGNVALVIYDSTVPAGTGEGVYIHANAYELSNADEIERAHKLLQGRRPVPFWRLDQVQGEAPVRLYKAVPDKMWMNDDGSLHGTFIDVRTEIVL